MSLLHSVLLTPCGYAGRMLERPIYYCSAPYQFNRIGPLLLRQGHCCCYREKPGKMMEVKYNKVVVKNQEMSEHMRADAEEQAMKAVETYRSEKEIADSIKAHFDSQHGPTWNCIVGRNFGSSVTHETKHYIYFAIAQLSILLWKCG
eukprot:GHVQ01029167.1.p1 GENE.GHVQ01029167.1~~GHVQ01029167.1.p1  ORF type:complete len:147 (+),score=18.24 GHVQ01029167.1:476-916(+)